MAYAHRKHDTGSEQDPSKGPARHRLLQGMSSPPVDGPQSALLWNQVMVKYAWPKVHGTLLGSLARRVGRTTAEEIVQDVAVLALEREKRFASPAEVRRWTSNMAWQRVLRRERATRRASPPLPRDAVVDVEATVLHRFDLEQLAAELAKLSPEDREAVTSPAAQLSPAGMARRHRVRERLRGKIVALPAILAGRRQGWMRRNQAWLAEVGPLAAGAGLSVAALVNPAVADTRPPTSPPAIVSSAAATGTGPPLESIAASGSSSLPPSAVRGSMDPAGLPHELPRSAAPARRTVVELAPAGGPGRAGVSDRDDDPPLLCVGPSPASSTCVTDPTAAILDGSPADAITGR